MKILHIWNTAGVGGIISKYMDRNHETESKVIARAKFDTYNFSNENVILVPGRARKFYIKVLLNSFSSDLIHIHSIDTIIPTLRGLHRNKPIVLHYHGSSIRGKWINKRKFWKKANKIFVATEDLLEGSPDNTILQPNPIDLDKIPQIPNKHQAAFFTSVEAGKADDLAKDLAKKHGIPLIIHNRDQNPLHHEKYLETIASYEYFIDVRRKYDQHGVFEVFSLGALEALAAGCKVIDWNGDIHETLPSQHNPVKVANRIHEMYKEIL